MDIFNAAREIPMADIAERYGFRVERGSILCPFHNDRHPSCRIYPGARGWWCFVCGEGGSGIDFVAKLAGCSVLEAAKKLCADFGIPVDEPGEKPSPEAMRAARRERYKRKADEEAAGRLLRENLKTLRELRENTAEDESGVAQAKLQQLEYQIFGEVWD